MSTSTKRRARRQAATQPAATPETDVKTCEVCHITGTDKGDAKTLENWGEYSPYFMCIDTGACDKRAGIIRDEAITEDDEAQAVEGAAEEPAEATT